MRANVQKGRKWFKGWAGRKKRMRLNFSIYRAELRLNFLQPRRLKVLPGKC